jgi:uridylate kinase
MDASAVSLARENNIPIIVFSIHNAGGFQAVVCGEGAYTIVTGEPG